MMSLSELHGQLFAEALELILSDRPAEGDMAFVRCLTPEVVESLAEQRAFAPHGWAVYRVADVADEETRTITADYAVELRETKDKAVLLLVDTALVGAGIDGIYSAAREVDEKTLFEQAHKLAMLEVGRRLSREAQQWADRALKKARGYGRRYALSPWQEFDFLVRVAAAERPPGELLYLLSLWPVAHGAVHDEAVGMDEALTLSRLFVERLLGTAVAGMTPSQRIAGLRLVGASPEQLTRLEYFLQTAAIQPLLPALDDLKDKRELWVNALRVEGAADGILSLELLPWRTNNGRVAKWSGLTGGEDGSPPLFILDANAANNGNYSRLEVRWRSRPENLAKDAVEYYVAIVTDMDEEVTARQVSHSGQRETKCRFTNDDFPTLSEDALISAKLVVSVPGNKDVEPQESEEFIVQYGRPPQHQPAGVGKKLRTLSEGLIELDEREEVSDLVAAPKELKVDNKGFVSLHTPQRGKSFRVFYPPLIREVEAQWANQLGAIGRWRVKVRASGERAAAVEFLPLSPQGLKPEPSKQNWERAANASRRMAERFSNSGGVAQVYDEKAKGFDTVVKAYLLAWAALLEEEADPVLALANTVEVQTLAGRTIGLIVLPSHPLRVAWHVAYDNLVFHAVFEQGAKPKEIQKEFQLLDGAMFPAFLPGLENGSPFVFADTLGFHAVGMVPDYDKEPKAAVAILARALGESETADTTPTVGKHSAQVLGDEILKYIKCHDLSRLLHIHALRPGDGLTVARALGRVLEQQLRPQRDEEEADDVAVEKSAPAFVLELYPSAEQQGVAGRFIAEAREKRRSGAGVLAAEDRWMLESLSLPGGINLPRLRWARKNGNKDKEEAKPKTAAHLAIAFDTLESRVVSDQPSGRKRPLFAYGLLSYFERSYTNTPSPLWRSTVSFSADGEKHPSDRTHSDRLVRLQQAIERSVARSIGDANLTPTLYTEISAEKADSLRDLHRLCDWVITLDRNGGVEYFDSPRENKEIYDVYVIDTVPEREDLGYLQLITSTSNLAEVRNLLDGALDQMGLSRSRRNAEFLMDHLKALSGRLAIRLTGQQAPTSELIALALSHANSFRAAKEDECWASLETGFLIPVDDVLDLLPPLSAGANETEDNSPLTNARPDLIYVSAVPRKGLSFQFIEVKYRRHLRSARSADLLEGVHQQVQSLRKRWDSWYGQEDVLPSFRAMRRAKLARLLRFYADKARRHYLPAERYEIIVNEIERMVEKGGEYSFAAAEKPDCGWIFCPEYNGGAPLQIAPPDWETRIFLFGPALLPDSDFGRDAPGLPVVGAENGGHASLQTAAPATESPADLLPSADIAQTLSAGSFSTATAPTTAASPTASPQPGNSGNGATEPLSQESPEPRVVSGEQEPAICLGKDSLTSSEVYWPLTIRGNPHLLIAGLPGMGKTTCLLNLCKQMIEAEVRPIVFSYHQDIDERLEQLFPNVRFLDFNGLGFNPLQVTNRDSRLAYLDMAGAIRDIFVAIYPELGDIQGERIRQAIKQSFIEQGWGDRTADLEQLVEPPFGRFVQILRDDPRPDRGLRSLLARLEELEDYGFFELVESPGSLWEHNQPTVIRIHTTQNDNLQKAFASLVFYGLYKDMFRRGTQERISHAIIFDEAHRAARLRLIPTMAKECRKYGISLVLASQEARDFNVSLFSAIANYLVLRLNETDAKALVRNVATFDQERLLVDKLKQMERFKALYFREGRKKPAAVSLRPLEVG